VLNPEPKKPTRVQVAYSLCTQVAYLLCTFELHACISHVIMHLCLTCALRVPYVYLDTIQVPMLPARAHTHTFPSAYGNQELVLRSVCVCVLVCLLVCVCTARHESRRDTGAESQYQNQLTTLTLVSVRVLIVEPMNVYPLSKT